MDKLQDRRLLAASDLRRSLRVKQVEESFDVRGLPNFATSFVGQAISIYAQRALPRGVSQSDRVEARVAWRGDIRGGRFVLLDDNVRKV